MVNGVHNKQGIVINQMEMKLGQLDWADFDEIIVFDKSAVEVITMNARVDAWVLPFINISGMYGVAKTKTNVNLLEPFALESNAESNGGIMGLVF
tara:strand:- start:552 stop:836 length:285 start_codon:yes stop_codon:yes gene_type:complete